MVKIYTIPKFFIEMERGRMGIHEYIYKIIQKANYGNDTELSLADDLFNLDIVEY